MERPEIRGELELPCVQDRDVKSIKAICGLVNKLSAKRLIKQVAGNALERLALMLKTVGKDMCIRLLLG